MFKDLPEGETHSFLDPDWVSDCHGAKILEEGSHFICRYCRKPCKVKQLHDTEILTLSEEDSKFDRYVNNIFCAYYEKNVDLDFWNKRIAPELRKIKKLLDKE